MPPPAPGGPALPATSPPPAPRRPHWPLAHRTEEYDPLEGRSSYKSYTVVPTQEEGDESADIDHAKEEWDEVVDEQRRISSQSLFSRSNAAIPMSYALVGFISAFTQTPLSVFMIESLVMEPSQQNTISVLQMMPWSFKLVYGFLSDACPICGLRRKPYLFLGYAITSLAYLVRVCVPLKWHARPALP